MENLEYIWVCDSILDDDVLMDMAPGEFMAKFKAAMNGEKNEFSPYVRRQKNRPRTRPRNTKR